MREQIGCYPVLRSHQLFMQLRVIEKLNSNMHVLILDDPSISKGYAYAGQADSTGSNLKTSAKRKVTARFTLESANYNLSVRYSPI